MDAFNELSHEELVAMVQRLSASNEDLKQQLQHRNGAH